MKGKLTKTISVIVFIIIVGAIVYNYAFNSKHRDIAGESASASLSATVLFEDFQKDEATATTRFLDKVIEIEGVISAVEEGGVVLGDQIQVGLDTTKVVTNLANGSSLTIKGRCVGYDELLEMVKIDQAVIINK